MKTTYFGIFPNGDTIEKLTLQEVTNVEDIEYILRCVKTDSWANPSTFTLLTSEGVTKKLVIGDFELVDIGEESVGNGGGEKKITIKELRTGDRIQTKTTMSGVRFFTSELLPLLKKLNEVGGWEMYKKYLELDRLIAKYGKLDDESTTC